MYQSHRVRSPHPAVRACISLLAARPEAKAPVPLELEASSHCKGNTNSTGWPEINSQWMKAYFALFCYFHHLPGGDGGVFINRPACWWGVSLGGGIADFFLFLSVRCSSSHTSYSEHSHALVIFPFNLVTLLKKCHYQILRTFILFRKKMVLAAPPPVLGR